MSKDHSRDQFETLASKVLHTSSSLILKSQLFAAVKPVMDEVLHLDTIVDVGCGIGAPAEFLTGHYNRYIGLDSSGDMVAAARRYNKKNTRAEFHAQDILSSHLPDNSADMILAVGVLHHVSNVEEILQAMKRIARPGAFLVILEPHQNSPIGVMIRLIRQFVDRSYAGGQLYHSQQHLVRLLELQGLEEVTSRYHGFLAPVFSQIILNPQLLFVPMSLFSLTVDGLLETYLPAPLQRFAVNLIINARFPCL